MPEAEVRFEALDKVPFPAPTAAKVSGEVVQLADGRAGVIVADLAAAQAGAAYVRGIFSVAKTTSMVVIEGQRLYWDKTNSKCKYTGDFFLGVATEDAAAAATTVKVDLNQDVVAKLDADLGEQPTLGQGSGIPGGANDEATAPDDFLERLEKQVILPPMDGDFHEAEVRGLSLGRNGAG